MAHIRGGFRRCLAVCLAIVATLGGLFGLALLDTAVTGDSTPSSILLGGIGFILVLLSALVLIFAYRQWTAPSPVEGGE